MKYHINDDYEVKPCSATEDGRCPFWGRHSGNNHYNNENDAINAIETILSKKHTFSFRKKNTVKVEFIKHREETRKSLINYSNVDNNSLEHVENVDEMIQKWFNGDKETYSTFKNTINNEEIKDDTKKSVSSFLQKGMSVKNTKNVKDLPIELDNDFSNDFDFDSSEITLIDDTPDKVDLEDLRNGHLNAFKFNH